MLYTFFSDHLSLQLGMLFTFFSGRSRNPQRYTLLTDSCSSLCVAEHSRVDLRPVLSFTAAVPRSVHYESPDTPPSQRASLVATPSSSERVTRCSALRLLLRRSTARCFTSTQRLSSSSKLVAPSLTQATGCRRDAVSRWLQICTRRASPSALLETCVLLKGHSNPLVCMVSQQPIAVRMVE